MGTTRLEGGCFVTHLDEGTTVTSGIRRERLLVGRDLGAKAISLRLLEFAPGLSSGYVNGGSDEVAYVLEGRGRAFLDGWPIDMAPDTAVFVAPGRCLTVENPGPEPLVLASSLCPEPGAPPVPVAAVTSPAPGTQPDLPLPAVRLSDRVRETTGDRWFSQLVDHHCGSRQVTQFVGSIPPGRAPDHYHHYEEVLCVLRGEGKMWAGRTHAPVGPGSVVYLPRGQVHCMENTGKGELRLLGTFYPAGSPAVRYDTEQDQPL